MKKMTCAHTVLVGVLKSKRDLRLLLKEKWYRIPVAFLPKRPFAYIAFYQPAAFGPRHGKRIEYYARVAEKEVRKRIELLPDEPRHPRALENYVRFSFRHILKLDKPLRNIIPRRVSFGFTTLATLRSAHDILQLYGVPPTEQLLGKQLIRAGVRPNPEYTVSAADERFRLDFAIFCADGRIAIECDNDKAHNSKTQKQRDKRKDGLLRYLGWRVLRFSEREIIEQLDRCTNRVQYEIRSLGGISGE